MKKRSLSLVLVLILLTVLIAGCGTGKTSSTSSSTATSSSSAGGASSSSDESSTGQLNANDPTYTVYVVKMTSGDFTDEDLIAEEVSKISKELINCVMDLTMISSGAYAEQINLMLSSGENLDIMDITGTPISTYVANGQILPLDDLLDEHGQGILGVIDKEFLDAGRVAGELFGLVTNRDLGTYPGFYAIKEMADKHNLDMESITTLDALEEALIVIRDNEPDFYPTVMNQRTRISSWGWDNLGSANTPLGVLLENGLGDTTVVNLFESDEYRDIVDRMYKWMNMGLLMPDINSTDSAESLMKANKVFGSISGLKPNSYLTKARSSNHEVVISPLGPALSTSSNIQMHLWTVANNSKDPVKATQMLNLMYTNADINNLCIFGVEDVHYKFVDEANHVIDYVDGLDATNTTWAPTMGWSWPNQFIGYIWNGDRLTVWEELEEFNRDMYKSKAMAFAFDQTNVKNEVTACTSVVAKYHIALMCGALDPDQTLDQFNKELYDAGLQTIINEKQKQFDEVLANQ